MADNDAYEVITGGLKLKCGASGGIKKKKKKSKSKTENILEKASTSSTTSSTSSNQGRGMNTQSKQQQQQHTDMGRTPAEIAFSKMAEKRSADRILKKATKTHKQRVEDLNTYLDGLTEHYDIQKVSWTK